jgi:hypothetical protein
MNETVLYIDGRIDRGDHAVGDRDYCRYRFGVT